MRNDVTMKYTLGADGEFLSDLPDQTPKLIRSGKRKPTVAPDSNYNKNVFGVFAFIIFIITLLAISGDETQSSRPYVRYETVSGNSSNCAVVVRYARDADGNSSVDYFIREGWRNYPFTAEGIEACSHDHLMAQYDD